MMTFPRPWPLGLALAVAVTAAAADGPSITPAFFAAHRERLLADLPEGSVAVLRSAPEPATEVGDVYRQDSDFWYLTGFPEPGTVAVLRPKPADGKRYLLFVRPKEFRQEQWTGLRAGTDGAKKEYQADEAVAAGELWQRLPELLRGATSLYYRDGGDREFRDRLLAAWAGAGGEATSPRPVADLSPLIHARRLIKGDAEQVVLRRAVELSVAGHRAALAQVGPGRYEYEMKAAMVGTCLDGGATRMAYPPILGSGPNSVILHYERADRQMKAGEMVVNDSACEYGLYAADVTRSYPISGRFTPEQRAIYEIVLAAQKAGFEKVKPGTPVGEVYRATVAAVVDGLLKLGLLTGTRDDAMKSRAYTKFYPHGCCHWIGLNVHDVGGYGVEGGADRWDRYFLAKRPLQPGMLLTVEPGIYIPEGSTSDPKWWNIGVRIEDDLLVTVGGMECLSCSLPREVADVEKALGRKN